MSRKEKVNCLIVDDEPVAREIIESYIEKLHNVKLVKSCKNVSEAFEMINSETIDLIFLDINMPEISGLSFAKSIPSNVKVVFTTAYREFAVEGFDLHVVDYLLKPIAFDRFLKAVQKYFDLQINKSIESIEMKQSFHKEGFFVRSDRKMVNVKYNEILYIESSGDYVKIYQNEQTLVTRETISNIESKLPQEMFLRVHRSFIVAMTAISGYTNEFVEVGNKAIPISRSYKESVLQKLEFE